MSKARISYSVLCHKHGTEGKMKDVRELRVQRPKSRRGAFKAGCPICKKGAMHDHDSPL